MRGLSSDTARARLADTGPNALPEAQPESAWRRWLRQFRSPLIAILGVALAVDLITWAGGGRGEWPLEAIAITLILVLNAALGFWQERKAERALEALRTLAAPTVWVQRDGRTVSIPARDLVPGDWMRLEAGDRVPADAVLDEVDDVVLDEAVLTGESVPVPRLAAEEILSGTLVVRGRAWATVVRTGSASAMGRLASLLGTVVAETTPLQRRLERFGRQIAIGVLVVATGLMTLGLAMEGVDQFTRLFLLTVALAVAAVPEGLPAAIGFALALGVERMARRRAVVRRMDAVEALGSVTVIATDKTGTLTENRMRVQHLDTPDRERALRAMVLANDAEPHEGGDLGDPLEVALLAYARDAGVEPADVRSESPRAAGTAFDSAWRFMRVTVLERGAPTTWLKGAPEVLVERSDLSAPDRAAWLAKAEVLGRTGQKALALAWADGERGDRLHWLGLVGLWDPPRPDVAEAMARCRAAGIRVVMITGDHPATAQAVAQAVGLTGESGGAVLTGMELEGHDAAELQHRVRGHHIFARVTAEQKLRIVEALQGDGEIVAVTGDGVNDAPALKRADVGIAMGQRGSAVTREVADLVLLDDHFATIVAAIEEGRSIFENIRKFLRFLFSTNFSEVLVVAVGFVAALMLGYRTPDGHLLLPLTAAQLLWINLVTDGAPAMALALDRNPDLTTTPPRPPSEPLLDRRSLLFIVLVGGGKAILAMALLLLLPAFGLTTIQVGTAVFLFVAGGQVLLAYPSREALGTPRPNRALHLAVLGTILLQPIVIMHPVLAQALDTAPIPALAWAAVAAAAVLAWLGAVLVARVLWAPGHQRT